MRSCNREVPGPVCFKAATAPPNGLPKRTLYTRRGGFGIDQEWFGFQFNKQNEKMDSLNMPEKLIRDTFRIDSIVNHPGIGVLLFCYSCKFNGILPVPELPRPDSAVCLTKIDIHPNTGILIQIGRCPQTKIIEGRVGCCHIARR